MVLASGPSLDTPAGSLADEEAEENTESDSSLEKFITDERIHLISIIKVWMQKNVPNFFERVIFVCLFIHSHCKITSTYCTQTKSKPRNFFSTQIN